MLTMADGGGIQEPLILADVICEQPLMATVLQNAEFCDTVSQCANLTMFVSQLHICEWASEYVEGRGAVLVAGSVVDKEWERISGCITEVTLGADLGQSVVWIV